MAEISEKELFEFINERLKEDQREAFELATWIDSDNYEGGLANPNRILQEVYAKRGLLNASIVAHEYNDQDPWYSCAQAVIPEQWREAPEDHSPGSGCSDWDRAGGECDCAAGRVSLRIMRNMAVVWADHPNYREEWKL